jgi:hypothetical protein
MRSVPLVIPPYKGAPIKSQDTKTINLSPHLKAKLEKYKNKKVINKLDRIDEKNK